MGSTSANVSKNPSALFRPVPPFRMSSVKLQRDYCMQHITSITSINYPQSHPPQERQCRQDVHFGHLGSTQPSMLALRYAHMEPAAQREKRARRGELPAGNNTNHARRTLPLKHDAKRARDATQRGRKRGDAKMTGGASISLPSQ